MPLPRAERNRPRTRLHGYPRAVTLKGTASTGSSGPKSTGDSYVNKSEVCTHVAAHAGVSRSTANSVVSVVFSTIGDALAGDDTVAIVGFGTFSTRERAARRGRNPATGEAISIAASKTPAFKTGKKLRDKVNPKPVSRRGDSEGALPWQPYPLRGGRPRSGEHWRHTCTSRRSRWPRGAALRSLGLLHSRTDGRFVAGSRSSAFYDFDTCAINCAVPRRVCIPPRAWSLIQSHANFLLRQCCARVRSS